MGSGKTSVGRALGQHLNWAFHDLDTLIEEREGRKIADIFQKHGEREFRRAEHGALKQLLQELNDGRGRIVALGGGAFVHRRNAALLNGANIHTVFLDAPVEVLWKRCCNQASETGMERPLLRSREQFRRLYEERRSSYRQARVTIQTGKRQVKLIAAEIVKALALKRSRTAAQQGESSEV
jgi:shikimate kinase